MSIYQKQIQTFLNPLHPIDSMEMISQIDQIILNSSRLEFLPNIQTVFLPSIRNRNQPNLESVPDTIQNIRKQSILKIIHPFCPYKNGIGTGIVIDVDPLQTSFTVMTCKHILEPYLQDISSIKLLFEDISEEINILQTIPCSTIPFLRTSFEDIVILSCQYPQSLDPLPVSFHPNPKEIIQQTNPMLYLLGYKAGSNFKISSDYSNRIPFEYLVSQNNLSEGQTIFRNKTYLGKITRLKAIKQMLGPEILITILTITIDSNKQLQLTSSYVNKELQSIETMLITNDIAQKEDLSNYWVLISPLIASDHMLTSLVTGKGSSGGGYFLEDGSFIGMHIGQINSQCYEQTNNDNLHLVVFPQVESIHHIWLSQIYLGETKEQESFVCNIDNLTTKIKYSKQLSRIWKMTLSIPNTILQQIDDNNSDIRQSKYVGMLEIHNIQYFNISSTTYSYELIGCCAKLPLIRLRIVCYSPSSYLEIYSQQIVSTSELPTQPEPQPWILISSSSQSSFTMILTTYFFEIDYLLACKLTSKAGQEDNNELIISPQGELALQCLSTNASHDNKDDDSNKNTLVWKFWEVMTYKECKAKYLSEEQLVTFKDQPKRLPLWLQDIIFLFSSYCENKKGIPKHWKLPIGKVYQKNYQLYHFTSTDLKNKHNQCLPWTYFFLYNQQNMKDRLFVTAIGQHYDDLSYSFDKYNVLYELMNIIVSTSEFSFEAKEIPTIGDYLFSFQKK